MKQVLKPSAILGPVVGLLLLGGCATFSRGGRSVRVEDYGKTPDGTPVSVYTLRNARGAEATITNYGGIVISLRVPDRDGTMGDVVLGYDTLDDYVRRNPYFGCLIGRYGNRIAAGRFSLDGKNYALATNNGPNHLHGGVRGFDKVVWKARRVRSPRGPALELRHFSPDGDEGYPGNLYVIVVYTLADDNALCIDFTATTDRATVCNLTHHSYFNLACEGDVLGHQVTIDAERFTPVDSTLIPTGELRPVAGTPFDFRKPTAIGARISADDEQLAFGRGYDHNWVLNKPRGTLGLAARVYEPKTGRAMEVLTSEPGMQFYSGNYLNGSTVGKGGRVYGLRAGFCMEPQHHPDTPNKPAFPSCVLRPRDVYRSTIIYRFSTR